MCRRLRLSCRLNLDRTGTAEEFTSDVTDVALTDDVSHLSSEGLAKIGTRVTPGMILIGKIGQKSIAARDRLNEVELLIASESERREYYADWLYDGSVYAPQSCFGTVVAAHNEQEAGTQIAIVEILLAADSGGSG